MITKSTATAEFHGGRSRVAALAWGQQATWDVMRGWPHEDRSFFTLTRWLPVPLLLGLGEVLEQISELVLRHESLRTLYHPSHRGEATQEVLASGAVTVEVFDRPAEDPVDFATIVNDCIARMKATGFDHDKELPVRFSVATHEGIPVLLMFGVSHLSADHMSTDLLSAELTALLKARADGTAAPAARQALQPVDLATMEHSPEGQLCNVEAMRYLRQQLDRLAPGLVPVRAVPSSPRFFRAELESDAIPVAVRAAARRYRSTTSVVLLSITTALVRCFCPGPVYPLDIMQSNRVAPELFATVSSLNQAVRTAVDLTAGSFGEVLHQSESVMAAARRRSRYDGRAAKEVVRTVASSRGTEFEPGFQFNDMWSTVAKSAARPAGGLAELDRLTETTTFDWPQKTDSEGMAIFLDTRGTPERINLSLMADTALLPPEDIRAFLFAFERIAIVLATSDITFTQIEELFAEHRTHAGNRSGS
ncbi:hypothetical protein GCM10010174_73320 [Kutzneria viridogrisea]|uniref:Condensation domain-containing protein n=1 Tax=Kutzneria viridogrisea TaxID=47990 RepID=A0ABR6BVU9_9PSEU|nr:hypothetical protein [Kutzneria viridogrisea]